MEYLFVGEHFNCFLLFMLILPNSLRMKPSPANRVNLFHKKWVIKLSKIFIIAYIISRYFDPFLKYFVNLWAYPADWESWIKILILFSAHFSFNTFSPQVKQTRLIRINNFCFRNPTYEQNRIHLSIKCLLEILIKQLFSCARGDYERAALKQLCVPF